MELKISIIILMVFLLSGCGTYGKTDRKIELSSYSENIFEIKGKYNLDISCDVSNIDIYTWKREDIKFEIKKRVSGKYKEELLKEKLENFAIDIKTDKDTVFLDGRYRGSDKDSLGVIVDYTIYMPKTIEYMNYKLEKGKIKLFDDVRGVLKAELDNADIEINKFDGSLNICGKEGNVKISGGKMSGACEVKKDIGNINIKSEFDENGKYDICTGLGHIDLFAHTSSGLDFETVGELTINEFADNYYKGIVVSSEEKMTKVRIRSELGKISIRKY